MSSNYNKSNNANKASSLETAYKKKDHKQAGLDQEKLVSFAGKKIPQSDIIKFGGLILFFVIMLSAVAFFWPLFKELFEPGGVDRVIEKIQEAGILGVLIFLGLQFIQVVVSFIPGEVVQAAAGVLYGPIGGTLVITLGCVLASTFVFFLVKKLGAPFVQAMVPKKYMEKFEQFEESGKLNVLVFLLFVIPGLPKDIFTYIVPLTSMPGKLYIPLSNLARVPSIFFTAFAFHGLVDGNIAVSIALLAFAATLMVLGIIFRNKIFDFAHKLSVLAEGKKR